MSRGACRSAAGVMLVLVTGCVPARDNSRAAHATGVRAAPAAAALAPAAPAPSTPSKRKPNPPPARPAQAAVCSLPGTAFDCDMSRRITALQRHLDRQPGRLGIVLRDRVTGAVWRSAYAGEANSAASTLKLGMAADLLLRHRAGTISLSDWDRALIDAMLHDSDDVAADELWIRYSGGDGWAFNAALESFGMTDLQPTGGPDGIYPYWGYHTTTADDLGRLINYVLTKTPADVRNYIVQRMRTVGDIQRWGVWAAGAAARPGVKNGWVSDAGWVVSSVGFAGPGERFTLAIMANVTHAGSFDEATTAADRVAQILFRGRF